MIPFHTSRHACLIRPDGVEQKASFPIIPLSQCMEPLN
jgi:hypothetical protein